MQNSPNILDKKVIILWPIEDGSSTLLHTKKKFTICHKNAFCCNYSNQNAPNVAKPPSWMYAMPGVFAHGIRSRLLATKLCAPPPSTRNWRTQPYGMWKECSQYFLICFVMEIDNQNYNEENEFIVLQIVSQKLCSVLVHYSTSNYCILFQNQGI